MKIGTLTFHSADNYGAALQAYALPKAVQELGFDCEIIDYRHMCITKGTEVEWPRALVKKYGPVKGCIKSVNRWRMGWFNKNRKDVKFNRFLEKKLPLSEKTYRTAAELEQARYDAVLFGSDQIWNEKLTGGFAPEYFGAGISGKKIAYAASSGTDSVQEEAIPLLSEFAALGIRERGLTQFLQKQGLSACNVVDPVLLLTKKQWRQIEAPLPKGLEKGKYIFVYTFDEQPVYDLARRLAKEENLPMVILRWCGRHDRFHDMIQYPNASPEEFLALVDNAAVVCTSSFHGTAFSVLFGKRFYCCTPAGFGSRTNSLLETVGLAACRVENGEVSCQAADHAAAQLRLAQLREQSLEFLKGAIEQ
ncbi:MAG: polysaccharide pyruvyl transferase family protein [Oscillospiraceae bacterium]|nr:polysaccharide pyruvyl transferase family protein [Oscillospiraceae bacterium]